MSPSRAGCQLERASQLQASIHFTLAVLGLCFERGMSLEQLVHKVRHFSGHRKRLIIAGWMVHGAWNVISCIYKDLQLVIWKQLGPPHQTISPSLTVMQTPQLYVFLLNRC